MPQDRHNPAQCKCNDISADCCGVKICLNKDTLETFSQLDCNCFQDNVNHIKLSVIPISLNTVFHVFLWTVEGHVVSDMYRIRTNEK